MGSCHAGVPCSAGALVGRLATMPQDSLPQTEDFACKA